MRQQKRTPRDVLYVCLFLVLILAVWLGLSLMPRAATAQLPASPNGAHDLSAADFSGAVYQSARDWQSWPDVLAVPGPAETGYALVDETGSPVISAPIPQTGVDIYKVQYATHQMRLVLTPGVTYGLSLRSCDYSMRLFINGEQIDLVGVPGTTKETTTPRVLERVYYFTPQAAHAGGDGPAGETDGAAVVLTVQAANFVHRDGAYPPNFIIGTAQNIAGIEHVNNLYTGLIIGCLLTAGLYHFALFLLNRRRFASLLFAACCVLLLLLTHKLIPVFWPSYNWYAAIRFEYLVHVGTFAALALLLDVLFPMLFHRWPARAWYALCAVYAVVICVTPSTVYTQALPVFDALGVCVMAYVLARLVWLFAKQRTLPVALALLGMLLICFLGVNDILAVNVIVLLGGIAGQVQTAPIGMVFFVFCYALVVSLEYAETQRRMEAAEQLVAEAEARYEALMARRENGNGAAHKTPGDYGLSARETDVLWLLLDGKTRPDIAAALGISLGTVNTYSNRICKKTGVGSAGGLLKLFGLPGGGSGPT